MIQESMYKQKKKNLNDHSGCHIVFKTHTQNINFINFQCPYMPFV